MKVHKIAIIGITGRMGTQVRDLAGASQLEVTSGVGRRPPGGWPAEIALFSRPGLLQANRIDVVIDFSLPELALEVAAFCLKEKKALVSGVTGLSEVHFDGLRKLAHGVPVLWSPNMSLAAAAHKEIARVLARLEEFTLQIEEVHHSGKIDKPSGTALELQKAVDATRSVPTAPPISIRGGGVRGMHRILALGQDEMLSTEHVVFSRDTFARGALSAARWLVEQSPGFYSMDHVLGMN